MGSVKNEHKILRLACASVFVLTGTYNAMIINSDSEITNLKRLKSSRASLKVSYKSPGIILPNKIKQKPASTSSLFRVGPLKFGQVFYRDALISPFAAFRLESCGLRFKL